LTPRGRLRKAAAAWRGIAFNAQDRASLKAYSGDL